MSTIELVNERRQCQACGQPCAATKQWCSKCDPPDFDTELETPDSMDDPKLKAEVEALPRADTSPSEFIDIMLRKYEENYMLASSQRWDGQQRWMGKENEEMRLVRIFHPYTFIRHLKRAGIAADFREDDHALLWLNSFTKAGRIGITARVWNRETRQMEAKTITSVQYPLGPEYSVMRFDQYNVPTNEKYRGWRTALLTLIVADVITEDQAEKAFGPAFGPAGSFYREQLFYHRRVTLGLDRY